MHVMRLSPALCGLLLAASFARSADVTATNGPAAPVTDLTTNAPIVVTASRANRTAEEMPVNVTVITAAAIRDSGAQTVVDALEKLGGLYFRHSSDNPGQSIISMRGFGENSHGRVLVLVDGQPLNTADMASPDWLRIPVGSVDRIEVLPGGQTALYGNYAVAGVINIITHQPGGTPSTSVSVTVGSDKTFAGHIGHVGSIDDTVHYTADLDWRKSDGWRDNSDYENTDVRASVSKDWTDRFSTDLAAFYTDNRSGMPGALTIEQMREDPRQAKSASSTLNEVENRTTGGSFDFDGQVGLAGRLDGAFAITHRTVESDYFSLPSFLDSTLDTYTFTPRYTLDDDLVGHRNKLLTGVDLGFNAYDLKGFSDFNRSLKTTDATISRANAGIYLQDEFWLTDHVALTLGARGELYRYTANMTDFSSPPPVAVDRKRVYRQSALDAALLYRPTECLKLFTRVSTLYRDPFVDELTSPYGYGPVMYTDLKPEVGHQYELGSSLALDKEWSAALSLYRLDMQDEITTDPITWAQSNLNETRRYGADASLTWQRPNVGLVSISYDYVDAFFAEGDNKWKEISEVPAHVVTTHGELDLPFDLATLATVHSVSAQYLGGDDAHVSPRLPAYATLDLGLRYRPHSLAGFELFAGVDNVFDNIYANYGGSYRAWDGTIYNSYYPAAGRTWKITASYRF